MRNKCIYFHVLTFQSHQLHKNKLKDIFIKFFSIVRAKLKFNLK